MSAVLEPTCVAVAGASGLVFGLAGAMLAGEQAGNAPLPLMVSLGRQRCYATSCQQERQLMPAHALGLPDADMALSWPTLRRPLFRSSLLFALLLYFVIAVATTPSGTSHFSHLGGLAAGLAAGLALLPAVGWQGGAAWRWALLALGWAGLIAIFTSLPLLFFLRVLPGVCCGSGC